MNKFEYIDYALSQYPFAGSPTKPLIVLTFYMLFVFVLGPKFMKNRKPYGLRKTMIFYNATQVISNVIMVIWVSISNSLLECV